MREAGVDGARPKSFSSLAASGSAAKPSSRCSVRTARRNSGTSYDADSFGKMASKMLADGVDGADKMTLLELDGLALLGGDGEGDAAEVGELLARVGAGEGEAAGEVGVGLDLHGRYSGDIAEIQGRLGEI